MPRAPKRQPRRPPQQRRSEETVAVLLQATEKVLSRDGFVAATTNRIAEAAGVSIGTLYHYFPTKEALVEALVHRMWADELAVLIERAPTLFELPLREAVREMVHGFVETIQKREVLCRRWYVEAPHLGQLELGLEMTKRAIDLVQAVLEHRRDNARPRDLAFAADFVVKMGLAAVRTGTRDWPEQLRSGQLEAEWCDMVTRYLVKG
jgi:AcrR family transcriptional regulator